MKLKPVLLTCYPFRSLLGLSASMASNSMFLYESFSKTCLHLVGLFSIVWVLVVSPGLSSKFSVHVPI